jgi:hypothetical protein
LDYDDFYKAAQLFEGKSAVSRTLGAKMKMIRWNKNKPIAINNLVLLSNSEFQKHIVMKTLSEVYDETVIKEIESKLNTQC